MLSAAFKTPLVIKKREYAHMTVGEERGYVRFACEGQPLMTIKTFGPPEKCPICGTAYPTSKADI